MKLKELLQTTVYGDMDICGITDDSRKVEPGCVFVCIDGAAVDGHRFAEEALKKGAAIIVCQRDLGLPNQIVLQDTRTVYAEMCAKWFDYPSKRLKILGVTGTNGKTSVSYMLKAILEEAGHKVGLIGTIQNMIGDEVLSSKNTTPGPYQLNELFSQMLDKGCDYAVMEVSSHALDQKRVHGIHFAAAMFTNLTQDHLDYHKTMENYMLAKKRLFAMAEIAILNYDDPWSDRIAEGLTCPVSSYSTVGDDASYSAKNIVYSPTGVDFEFVGYSVIGRMRLHTGGKFTVYNAMCAATCAVEMGVPIQTVCRALDNLKGVKGRAEVVPTNRDFTVIIDYAHTPDGLENVLSTFKECKKNRLVVLFGCGGDRDRTKRPLMAKACAALADFLIVTSDNPRTEDPEKIIDDILVGLADTKTKYVTIPNRVEAIHYAIENARKGDIIVLAGKGHETYQILENQTIHLDEREVVKEALERLK
ncbi:MAG: UDP-N-acetylmuramoyl-L-alanyl-D-glutamate--2,6-diaminopimelate ligase [Clostridia bacterium]|nr:UDP-N-acetylmuramoyl-L-alanyl-D-glutamate--2,6-diaminopimelate ligase [Clostridia bacterium]